MIEIPEAIILANQMNEYLKGKIVKEVVMNQNPNKLSWFNGDPDSYNCQLADDTIVGAKSYGGLVKLCMKKNNIIFSDGAKPRYVVDENEPKKHQMKMVFTDDTKLFVTIQLYGGICCFEGEDYDNEYYMAAKEKLHPLSDAFTLEDFKILLSDENLQKKSLKATLATEQRIPGLGNGVLQDILYNAKLHPKKKLATLSEEEINKLYLSIKSTLKEMIDEGGRSQETDLFGEKGRYHEKVSKSTLNQPCSICGVAIEKASYMGGAIYYCSKCQQI